MESAPGGGARSECACCVCMRCVCGHQNMCAYARAHARMSMYGSAGRTQCRHTTLAGVGRRHAAGSLGSRGHAVAKGRCGTHGGRQRAHAHDGVAEAPGGAAEEGAPENRAVARRDRSQEVLLLHKTTCKHCKTPAVKLTLLSCTSKAGQKNHKRGVKATQKKSGAVPVHTS